jgi:hypothetical protein
MLSTELLDIIYARYRYANNEKQDTRGLVIPESIGEAVEDDAEATMTWPRRLTKKPATWCLVEYNWLALNNED